MEVEKNNQYYCWHWCVKYGYYCLTVGIFLRARKGSANKEQVQAPNKGVYKQRITT